MLRVLVVDDSPTSRLLLRGIIESDPGMRVAGEAASGEDAVRLARELRPDLITMDLTMPGMDGFETTRRIMSESPTPVVVISDTLDPNGLASSFEALRAGALTVLPKPASPNSPAFESDRERLLTTIRLMADVKVIRRRSTPAAPGNSATRPPSGRRVELVALGASTGGPKALSQVLRVLPPDFSVPVLLVQHMTPGFTRGFVDWLQQQTALTIRVAAPGLKVQSGAVYVAPDEQHLLINGFGGLVLSEEPAAALHRPAVDVLFASVAQHYGPSAVGVLLTGMGTDGARGLEAIRRAGGTTLAQDEASCVVYGMPAAAVALHAVDQVLPLDQIGQEIVRLVRRSL